MCTVPKGLDTLPVGTAELITSVLASGTLPYLWLPQVPHFSGELTKYETPVQFRISQQHGSNVYHVAAKYHPTALDIWGKDDNRICQEGQDKDTLMLHREIALAYAFYYSGIRTIPSSEKIIQPILESFGLPAANLYISPADPATPWGMARIVVDEMMASVVKDGWNADGSYSNQYNTSPYSDFNFVDKHGEAYSSYKVKTEYSRNNSKGIKKKSKKTPSALENSRKGYWPWQPLIESNGLGYFSKQAHVTPFCGFTGRLYGMDKEYYNSFRSPAPQYNYEEEAQYVLNQTKNMASDDLQKMMIEFYDSKMTSILPLQLGWSIDLGQDNFDLWFYDMVVVNTMYGKCIWSLCKDDS